MNPPSSYYREVWDYKNTDPLCTERALSSKSRNAFFGNNMADEKVKSLTNAYVLINSP